MAPHLQAFLDRLEIATPCEAVWEDMSGDARSRHCAQCDRRVYDLSQFHVAEIEALFGDGGELPCIRLWRRADGRVLTADCPVGLRRVGLSRKIRVAAIVMLTCSLAIAGKPAKRHPKPKPPKVRTMGKVACPPVMGDVQVPLTGGPMLRPETPKK